MDEPLDAADRRRVERRQGARVADLTLPEFRRMLLTSTLFVVVLLLFLWMVRTVVIAAIVAVIVAFYLRPLYLRALPNTGRTVAALLALAVVIAPLAAVAVYSWSELRHATAYIAAHEQEVVARIEAALSRLPFLQGVSLRGQIRDSVLLTTNYGAQIVEALRERAARLTVAIAVFFFTAFYALTEWTEIIHYVRSKVPPRYSELAGTLETNVRGVLYGAVYATVVTQTIKSIVILLMNLAFRVPLPVVLAILAFGIGFLPVVGSWVVYVPVAIWLVVFRDAWVSALLMLLIGFLGNTLFVSMYVRPKLAAEKSRVLNFYWMFVGLVTGVYTFGVVGILLGPVVIGLLKAVFDTVTTRASWRLVEADGEPLAERTGGAA